MADWYVDSSATGAQDGTSTTDAWNSIETAMAGTSYWGGGGGWGDTGGPVTAAGDVVWIKDDHHEVWQAGGISSVRVRGSTAIENRIIYRGDIDGVKWTPTSGKPQIEMYGGSTNAYFYFLNANEHITVENVDFHYGAAHTSISTYGWRPVGINSWTFRNCQFGGASGSGRDWRTRFFHLHGTNRYEDCVFDTRVGVGSVGSLFYCASAHSELIRCEIHGWKHISNVYTNTLNTFDIQDTTIDDRDSATGSLFLGDTSNHNFQVRARNLDYGDFTPVSQNVVGGNSGPGTWIEIQDADGVPGAYYRAEGSGEIETDVDGNFVMSPSATCDGVQSDAGLAIPDAPWPAAAGVSRDYTVKCTPTGWTTFPTADEFYLEVGYRATTSDPTMTWTRSTAVMSANGTEYDFTVSNIVSADAGVVILRVRLLTNDGGTGEDVTVNMVPVVV